MFYRFLAILVLALQTTLLNGQELKVASIFSDGAVLQQNKKVKIWGSALPNSEITVTPSWSASLTVKAGESGEWCAELKTLAGDYTRHSVKISSSGKEIKLDDILFGEVWLISGQSNMEMTFHEEKLNSMKIEGGKKVIEGADDPYLREFKVARCERFYPQKEVIPNGGWKSKNRQNVEWFSAVGYFFGKILREKLNVPVGLINSSYGGTPVESWIPEKETSADIYNSKRSERDEEIRMSTLGEDAATERFSKWIEQSQLYTGKELATMDFSNFPKLSLPNYFFNTPKGESLGGTFIYKKITLPSPSGLTLELPQIDRNCQIFFNGEMVYQEILPSRAYKHPRVKIPGNLTRAGENIISINVLTSLWNGGIVGDPSEMRIISAKDTISLAGEWSYLSTFDLWKVNAAPKEGLPNAFLLSSLYNGMIHPLGQYAVKGFLWYQGEANLDNSTQYPVMLGDMVKGWRSLWGEELPFYYVQIAPYKYSGKDNTEAARMREIMSSAYKNIPASDVVLTVDLGDSDNIHPARKAEVGERLALKALYKTYGQNSADIRYPDVQYIKQVDGKAVIGIGNTYGKIISAPESSEFELSEDGTRFFKASHTICDNEILIQCDSVRNPLFVRHAYHNGSNVSVFNAKMLPLDCFSKKIINAPCVDNGKSVIWDLGANRRYEDHLNFNDRYADELALIAKKPAEQGFLPNIDVLFVGSSSVRMWKTLQQDMYPLRVVNNGFGGSTIRDIIYHYNILVKPYNPKKIVLYVENDVIPEDKLDTQTLFEFFKIFCSKVHKDFPSATLYIVSLKPSPLRFGIYKEQCAINTLLKKYAGSQPLTKYIDVSSDMIRNGQPDKRLFSEDMLHMNSDGYALWTRIIRKKIKL